MHISRRVVAGGVLLGVLVVAALVGAYLGGVFLRDRPKSVSVGDALRRFRENDRTAKELEGVYVYATSGGESLDVLGGAYHRYPATTSVTALRVPCGLQLDWAVLQGRADTWTFCSTPAGVEVHSSVERHRFFGRSDRTAYLCAGSVLIPSSPAAAGAVPALRRYVCKGGRAEERGVAQTIGRDTVGVGGRRVDALHARTVSTVSGANHGTETLDWWLDTKTALPVRIVIKSRTSRQTFIGVARYSEDADLRLVSETPKR